MVVSRQLGQFDERIIGQQRVARSIAWSSRHQRVSTGTFCFAAVAHIDGVDNSAES